MIWLDEDGRVVGDRVLVSGEYAVDLDVLFEVLVVVGEMHLGRGWCARGRGVRVGGVTVKGVHVKSGAIIPTSTWFLSVCL